MAFDEKKANRVRRFIECLKHTKGEFHGKPFKLLPWQDKIISDVFGTVRDDDLTMRQFTTAYIEIPKKQGKEQARIIRNAARYLTEEAQGGIVAGNTRNDNRQTFHSQSSVNLTGNSFYIRSDQDIHDLAVEIATLTRTEQRGRGLRAT